ncbi:MAG TPA: hypothetical protein VLA61_02985 [Ideonella sp.]|nr:hypothetical protein [Ideonella sp.]HSI47210.1 hypothetical protein [Ideonella sp.]
MAVTRKPIAGRIFGDKVSVAARRSKLAERAQAKLSSLDAGKP